MACRKFIAKYNQLTTAQKQNADNPNAPSSLIIPTNPTNQQKADFVTQQLKPALQFHGQGCLNWKSGKFLRNGTDATKTYPGAPGGLFPQPAPGVILHHEVENITAPNSPISGNINTLITKTGPNGAILFNANEAAPCGRVCRNASSRDTSCAECIRTYEASIGNPEPCPALDEALLCEECMGLHINILEDGSFDPVLHYSCVDNNFPKADHKLAIILGSIGAAIFVMIIAFLAWYFTKGKAYFARKRLHEKLISGETYESL